MNRFIDFLGIYHRIIIRNSLSQQLLFSSSSKSSSKSKSIKSSLIHAIPKQASSGSVIIQIRLNRCLRPLTRKLADSAIFEGKVLVNGKIASVGMKIKRSDHVNVNGIPIDVTVPAYNQILSPFDLEECRLLGTKPSYEDNKHVYIKLWKPSGYKTTFKRNMPHNMIELLTRDLSYDNVRRLYCIGDMAPSASGVVLLTSDRRLVDIIKGHKYPIESVFDIHMDENDADILDDKDSHAIPRIEDKQVDGRDASRIVDEKDEDDVDDIDNEYQLPGDMIISNENQPIIDHGSVLSIVPVDNEVSQQDGPHRYSMKIVERGRVMHNSLVRRHLHGKLSSTHRLSYAGITLQGLPSHGFSSYLDESEMKTIDDLLQYHGKPIPSSISSQPDISSTTST